MLHFLLAFVKGILRDALVTDKEVPVDMKIVVVHREPLDERPATTVASWGFVEQLLAELRWRNHQVRSVVAPPWRGDGGPSGSTGPSTGSGAPVPTPADLHSDLEAARDRLGGLHVVVDVWLADTALQPRRLGDHDPASWAQVTEGPLHHLLDVVQCTRRVLGSGGGTLVAVVPTCSLVGVAGLAPWSAVSEAWRTLVKSACRAWGPEGFRAHTVAVETSLLAGAPFGPADAGTPPDLTGDSHTRPGLASRSLPDDPPSPATVADLVEWLSLPQARHVAGCTLPLDGGSWMHP